tara:strand:+ start:2293 stop:5262 length:2970 start_codon:yes stop_codon:yes gene_type:complete
MPKKVLKLDQFHGGQNDHADPRDIADNELVQANEVMVDEVGSIRMMGGMDAHSEVPANTALPFPSLNPGHGLFVFSHDRTGGNVVAADLSGTHTGGDSDTVLIDSAAAFTSVLVGATVNNTTDGSSGTVVSVQSTTQLTLDDLTGGDDNSWDDASNDAYTITGFPQTGDDYMLMADTTNSQIDIYSKAVDAWSSNLIDLGSTANMIAVFYIADGILRVSDAAFGANNTNKWYGYIKRTHFNGKSPGGTPDAYDGWFAKDQEIAAPTRGIAGPLYGTAIDHASNTNTNLTDTSFFLSAWEAELDSGEYLAVNKTAHLSLGIEEYIDSSNIRTVDGSDDWNTDSFALCLDPGTGFNIHVPAASSSGGTIPAGTYEFGTTFIYDAEVGEYGSQESTVYKCAGTSLVASGEIWSGLQIFPASPYNPRITGGRLYTRIVDSGDSWTQVLEISLKDGIRKNLTETYSAWLYQDSTNDSTSIHFAVGLSIGELQALTYDLNTNRSDSITSTIAKYKTAVVANRMTYIGNIEYDGIRYGDMMIKSPVNQFDIFIKDRAIEASVRDGDEIIKLEEYADRILQFKKKKMHLINVSQEIEFLEDTFMHKGVLHPSAVCKTDFGIAWVNTHGVYLYDGQKVHNLFEKKGRRIVDADAWKIFTTYGLDKPMIGYFSQKRQLIIRRDIGYAGDAGNIYVYDMITGSWTTGYDMIPMTDPTSSVTNFVTDWNGDLVISDNGGYSGTTSTIRKWVDDLADADVNWTDNIKIRTKDIDFGHPGVRKKIYKVYVTYTGGVIGPAPEITEVKCVNDSSDSLDGTYFDIDTHGGQKTLIWFDTDNSGTSAPSGTGSYNDTIEVTQVGTNDSAESVAIALASAINEDAGAHTTAKVEGDTVIITDAANQAVTSATMSAGDTGFTVTQIQAGTSSTTAQNVDVQYAVDGIISYSQFDANLTSSTTTQVVAELKPSASINNVKSILLNFTGNASKTFKINDISIIYRLKNVK